MYDALPADMAQRFRAEWAMKKSFDFRNERRTYKSSASKTETEAGLYGE
jgi:hypothetical protein